MPTVLEFGGSGGCGAGDSTQFVRGGVAGELAFEFLCGWNEIIPGSAGWCCSTDWHEVVAHPLAARVGR